MSSLLPRWQLILVSFRNALEKNVCSVAVAGQGRPYNCQVRLAGSVVQVFCVPTDFTSTCIDY